MDKWRWEIEMATAIIMAFAMAIVMEMRDEELGVAIVKAMVSMRKL